MGGKGGVSPDGIYPGFHRLRSPSPDPAASGSTPGVPTPPNSSFLGGKPSGLGLWEHPGSSRKSEASLGTEIPRIWRRSPQFFKEASVWGGILGLSRNVRDPRRAPAAEGRGPGNGFFQDFSGVSGVTQPESLFRVPGLVPGPFPIPFPMPWGRARPRLAQACAGLAPAKVPAPPSASRGDPPAGTAPGASTAALGREKGFSRRIRLAAAFPDPSGGSSRFSRWDTAAPWVWVWTPVLERARIRLEEVPDPKIRP